jgi:hypothetical protein
MLNAFGGDSGLGGVKGLVPAPPSGSGASGFVLLANGTWGSSGGSSSVTTNGYVTIGTLIFQWGFYNAPVPNGTLFTITWPKPFTTAVFGCQATLINPSDVQSTATGIQVSGTPTTTSGVFWSTGYQSGSTSSLSGFYWLAYGM